MFGDILKNTSKNIFKCLVVLLKIWKIHCLLDAHIFSSSKQIYNIHQIPKTQKKHNSKKKKSSNPVKLREEGRERGEWVRSRGGGLLVDEGHGGFDLEATATRSVGGSDTGDEIGGWV